MFGYCKHCHEKRKLLQCPICYEFSTCQSCASLYGITCNWCNTTYPFPVCCYSCRFWKEDKPITIGYCKHKISMSSFYDPDKNRTVWTFPKKHCDNWCNAWQLVKEV